VVMSGATRIQTRYDRFERVPAAGICELMSPTAETCQIVFAIGICVPEVKESPANRIAPTIENKTRHPARNTHQTRLAEVALQRRVRPEKRPRRFLGRQFKLFTHSRSGLELDLVATSAEQRLNPRKKGNRRSRNCNRTKKPAP
jgi:hypothetical protein